MVEKIHSKYLRSSVNELAIQRNLQGLFYYGIGLCCGLFIPRVKIFNKKNSYVFQGGLHQRSVRLEILQKHDTIIIDGKF